MDDVGADSLTGGVNNDVFVSGAGFGTDRVTDFDSKPAGGQDLLDISGLGITGATFAAAVTIAQATPTNTLVTVGGGTITLVNVAAATFTQADFILAG